jgi:hypothetical protein
MIAGHFGFAAGDNHEEDYKSFHALQVGLGPVGN